MCIIITKDKGVKPLDTAYFDRAWDANSHGGGVVWKEKNGEVMFQKGFMEKKDFLDKLKTLNKTDTAFIAHFRIKSVGDVKPENCHPFVLDHVTFAHNGTLSINPFDGKTDSETFGLACLKDKTIDWIKDNQLLIEMALRNSKFAIMDNETGEIVILNKEYGKERDGAWFSNESAFPAKPVIYPQKWWEQPNYSGGYSGASLFLAKRDFGTKMYNPGKLYTFSKQYKAWVNKDTGEFYLPWGFPKQFVIDRRGLARVSPEQEIPADYPNKKYGRNCMELQIINSGQRMLADLLTSYHKTEYQTWDEREDDETNIHSLNIVLSAMRRLVRAGKEICSETLTDFIGHIPASSYRKYGLREMTQDWIDSILDDLTPKPVETRPALPAKA